MCNIYEKETYHGTEGHKRRFLHMTDFPDSCEKKIKIRLAL